MHERMPRQGLYTITDGPRPDLLQAVAAALRGGAALLQYRDKTHEHARRLAEARALRALCTQYRVPLIVNDDVELALAADADGVHLGELDGELAAARARLGAHAIIGVSCYDSIKRARQLAADGADYLAFGAFYPSPTKPSAKRATVELLREAQSFGLPLVAIGGITADNAQPLLDAGADFLAAISGVFAVPDPFLAAKRYSGLFETRATEQLAAKSILGNSINMISSHEWFQRAQPLMPGGVNSPVRAFKSVGGEPFFTDHADGAYLWDVDGKRYIDYVGSWGPMVAGHNHPQVRTAVEQAARAGLSFGTPCPAEVRMAEEITRIVPSVEMLRMVNSGTEATMAAVRLARGATGRDKIVKFEGCYHGHADAFLVKAGSGALTLGVPTSPGVPKALADLTLTLPYNDLNAARQLFAQCGEQIACLIIEPVAGNMNCIPPRAGYLQGLRDLCTQHGTILIFDEVMTGFRVALGGAQALYGITPDLTTFGKIIGGGMPVGAYGGKRNLMEQIAPSGPVYQAGTLSGNPIAMAAGLAMLEVIQASGFYAELERKTDLLSDGLAAVSLDAGVPFSSNRVCGMFGLFFTSAKVETYTQATACDVPAFNRFFHAMLERGVYLAPSAFEAGFMSMAHSEQDIADTLEAARAAFRIAAAG